MIKKFPHAVFLLTALLSFFAASAADNPAYSQDEVPLRGHFKDNFILLPEALPAPKTPVKDLSGNSLTMGDYKGEVVLLNFWATWCAPCIREMPSLDRLQAKYSGRPFRVVAVSLDRAGLQKVKPFLMDMGLKNLEILLDPRSKLARELVVSGLPTTFLLDDDGTLIGALQGPAEWDDEDAVALIEHFMPDREPLERAGLF